MDTLKRLGMPLLAGVSGVLVACGGGGGSGGGSSVPNGSMTSSPTGRPTPTPTATVPAQRSPLPGQSKIKHVVIIIQENRSFDDMFHGFAGADYATTGQISTGATVSLSEVPLSSPYDLNHDYNDARTSMHGGLMNGFNLVEILYPYGKPAGYTPPLNPAYVYVDRQDIEPYFALAHTYVLADRFFSSDADGSFVGHQYLIAGQAGHSWGIPNFAPWGCDAPGNQVGVLTAAGGISGTYQAPCFTYPSLGGQLDAKGIAWRYYAPPADNSAYIWSAYDAIKAVRDGPDWETNIITPETKILSDVAAGQLAPVTWVVPDSPDSDHPGIPSKTGPSWVTSVVNAVGQSQFWSSSVVFVLWDDWGGLYDHVPPPQLDYDGLGMRVPLIAISPYANSGGVAHTQYEFGSVLRFVEQTFGVAPIAASDSRANSFGSDVFNFEATPRTFKTIPTVYGIRYFETHAVQPGPPDSDL